MNGRRCLCCGVPRDRWGWCDGCKSVRDDLDAALEDRDDRGCHDTEDFDAARRKELHAARWREVAAYLRRNRGVR